MTVSSGNMVRFKEDDVLSLAAPQSPTHSRQPALTHIAFHPLFFFFPLMLLPSVASEAEQCGQLQTSDISNRFEWRSNKLLKCTAQLCKVLWGTGWGVSMQTKSFLLANYVLSYILCAHQWIQDVETDLVSASGVCFMQSFSFCLSMLHKYSLQVQRHKKGTRKTQGWEHYATRLPVHGVNSLSKYQSCRLPWLHQSGYAIQSVITAV